MADALDLVGALLLLAAAALAAVSALGVVRFTELLTRMHALTKASTGAIVLAALGAAVVLRSGASITTLVLVIALQLFTFPVGANLIARAVSGRPEDTDRRPEPAGGPDGAGEDDPSVS